MFRVTRTNNVEILTYFFPIFKRSAKWNFQTDYSMIRSSMKYIGVDYGTKRIGIAISDDEGQFAFPHAIIDAYRAEEHIKNLAEKEKVQVIVLGHSVASNDQPNENSADIQVFGEKLIQNGLVVQYEREGYSSVEAYRYQQDKGPADDRAAAIILQRYLDKQAKV